MTEWPAFSRLKSDYRSGFFLPIHVWMGMLAVSMSCLSGTIVPWTYSIVCISPITADVEHFFSWICWSFVYLLFENCVFRSFAHFWSRIFFLSCCYQGVWVPCVFWIRPLIQRMAWIIFSLSMGHLFAVSFAVQKLARLMQSLACFSLSVLWSPMQETSVYINGVFHGNALSSVGSGAATWFSPVCWIFISSS